MDRLVLDNGKYTILFNKEGHYPEKCLRYSEEWRDLVGDNLIFYLCSKIEQMELEYEKALEIAINKMTEVNGNKCVCECCSSNSGEYYTCTHSCMFCRKKYFKEAAKGELLNEDN